MDLDGATWRKSSYTGGENDYCVEIAILPETVGVRDSKDPTGGVLMFDHEKWAEFVEFLKAR